MGYGGYYKGEKKKPKKDKSGKVSLKEYSPFVLPELVYRKKKSY